jgi:histidinol phosphatase-like enzyme (inositol monophosphatase family)
LNQEISKRLAFAHTLADAAGHVIRPYFRKRIEIVDKSAGHAFDPVTEADKRAEEAIRELLSKQFPEDGILGEEYGETKGTSGYRWLIDPIDGTRAFIVGIMLWGTLIALEENGKPVIGILDQPINNERFIGAGGKAQLQTPETTIGLHVRACPELAHAVVTTTHPFAYFTPEEIVLFDRLAKKCRMSRFHGDCYSYAMLALGFIDCVVEAGLKPWDTAALIPIVEGAGGIITDWEGKTITGGGRVIAAGDARVHAQALKLLQF